MFAVGITIILLAGIITLFRTTQKTKEVALKKGIEDDDLFLFAVFLWLYALPPIATMLFVGKYNLVVALIFLTCYIPGMVMGKKVSAKLSKGYDYERKAGKEYDKVAWLGLLGIALVLFNWGASALFSFAESRRPAP